MKGETILITGGSRGIGASIVERLAADNRVISLSKSGDCIDAPNVTGVRCDLASPDEIASVVDQVVKDYPDISVLINNAAVLAPTPLVMMSDVDIVNQVTVNLMAPMLLTKRVLKRMMRRRAGRILNMISMSHRLCKQGDSVYAATKAGLEVFSKITNVEAHRYGITVNCLAISAMQTGMLERAAHDNPERIRDLIPHGEFAEIGSVMKIIEFYCDPENDDVGGQSIFLGGV
tara:strand:- start:18868 stop:19563 length:696 start_codon:yes stop_codon:yes gene_type:complete